MITFFELYYSDKIPARLIKLREKYRLTQSDVGNSSQVSQIEKGKRPITNTILYDLKERTGLDYADVIFGNLNEFIEELFYHCFSTILYKDFSIERYNKVYKFQSREYVEIQEICLRLAKTFANFNIQRKNFNEDSEELEMDTFHKKDDINIMMGDKGFNPARSLREPFKLITLKVLLKFGLVISKRGYHLKIQSIVSEVTLILTLFHNLEITNQSRLNLQMFNFG